MNPSDAIFELLQNKCRELTVKPAVHIALENIGIQKLAAFRDSLGFRFKDLASAEKLFAMGLRAIHARFAFARVVYELQHGPAERYAEEYFVAPEINLDTNEPTGAIELHAQIVLKPLTSEPAPPDSGHG